MLYNLMLFFHIFGASMIFMAIGILFTAMISMLHAKDTNGIRLWANLAVKMDILFPISTILTLVSALYLVFSIWGWGFAWINVSLAALLGNSILGMIFNLFRLKRVAESANRETELAPSDALLQKVRDRALWHAVSVMTMLTVGILFLMVIKPRITGSLMTMSIAVAAGFLLSNSLLGLTKTTARKDVVPFQEK